MRYVDTSGLSAPPAWIEKARKVEEKIQACIADGTAFEFRSLWTEDEMRGPLVQLLGPKCWYCETLIQRTDVQIDHFRPKSEVSGEPGHPGYWWLAYEVTNYRVICKHCNSGGARYNDVPEGLAKSSRFPLLAGTRATKPGDDLTVEQPVLLDPVRSGDPDLLGFDAAGFARRRSGASYSQAEKKRGLCRADETIRILALNATQITEQRRELMLEIGQLSRLRGTPVAADLIARKVGPQAQWSAAASAALAIHRAGASTPHRTGPPATAAALGQTDIHPRSNVDLVDLLIHLDADELATGIALTGRRAGREYHAELRKDGRISVVGRAWGTPQSAARAAPGRADVDGWDFWRLTVGGTDLSLAEFRAAHAVRGRTTSP